MNKLYVWLFTVCRKNAFVFYHNQPLPKATAVRKNTKSAKKEKTKNLTARERFFSAVS